MVEVISPVVISIPDEATRMRLEKDPAAFLIRSGIALSVLTSLRDGRSHRPADVRRAAGNVHPQMLKETIDHLDTFGLASLVILPGSKPVRHPHGVAVPVALKITKKGQDILRHMGHYQDLVKRDRALLPPATIHRWLEA